MLEAEQATYIQSTLHAPEHQMEPADQRMHNATGTASSLQL
jgi:hypothetical protein